MINFTFVTSLCVIQASVYDLKTITEIKDQTKHRVKSTKYKIQRGN